MTVIMEGTLSKWTNVMKGWQYRWFVLDDTSGLLTYYTSKEKMLRGARRGCVCLKGAAIGIDDEDDSAFTITIDHKTFHLQARDADDREKWVRALEDTIFRHQNQRSLSVAATASSTTNAGSVTQDLDNKVAEADVYLQLMIEQTQKLDHQVQSATDPDEQAKYQSILQYAKAMLESVKHSIVLLQIAKNTAHPLNGIHSLQTPLQLPAVAVNNTQHISGVPQNDQNLEFILGNNSKCHSKKESSMPSSSTSSATTEFSGVVNNSGNITVSYSSSEGEEDFFDANDSPYFPSSTQCHTSSLRSVEILDEDVSGASSRKTLQKTPKITPATNDTNDNNLDYDALYEDEIDGDDVHQLESHGSVIRHLLSQVKIGMDLTKVVLPTFILERRSLLEMYADYFAHPDMFLRIAEECHPRERFVQVVRWYLASYHAGRKGSVAKKPYNPILGEIFRCHWNNNDENQTVSHSGAGGESLKNTPNAANNESVSGTPVGEGPVPWCRRDQLVFLAEQVSHHPPISAFYAEHYEKRIQFNAHVYTKSKFLGLSVCVYNIGQGVVSLLDYDEDYVVTFPNGYGRSILTVPWIELGGTVTVACEKTGYSATIEFHTKPFYGTKKHRITAELFEPPPPPSLSMTNDDGGCKRKHPFLTVHGEWNGVMEAKWTSTDKIEEFINVNALSVVKKQVRPIVQQDLNESRRLWKEVTAGLRFNAIERATDAKQFLEQRQRDQAKERKSMDVNWQQKYFCKASDDSWQYITPLKTRLRPPQRSSTTTTPTTNI